MKGARKLKSLPDDKYNRILDTYAGYVAECIHRSESGTRMIPKPIAEWYDDNYLRRSDTYEWRGYMPTKRDVFIEVNKGTASVMKCPSDIEVTIVDLDMLD